MTTPYKSSESFVIFNNQDNFLNVYEPTDSERNTEKFFAESSKINEINATEIQLMEITKTSIYKQQNMKKFLQNNLLTDERKKEISFYQQGDDTETNDEVFKAIIKKDEKDENSELDSTNENESQYFRSSQKETKKAEIKDP
jgi:LPS O-antigen subunit length determinant protein (WzzB/FepE family)